jgi:hypothetical protein
MAYFAEIDSNNIVTRVLSIPDKEENRGQEFLSIDLGLGGKWIQTSYNNTIRNIYAGIGYMYVDSLDVFVLPRPFPSWILNSEGYWESPTPRPTTPNKVFVWDEESQVWVESELINL